MRPLLQSRHRARHRAFVALATVSVLLAAGSVTVTAEAAPDDPWMDTSLSPDERADLLAAAMTLDQKVALFNLNGETTVPELGVPPRHEIDGTLGVHSSTQGTTALPSGLGLASSADRQLAGRWGAQTAREAWQLGYNGDAAPTLDVDRSPYYGRMWEGLGEDAVLSGTIGAEAIDGIQSQEGVYALTKHYGVYTQETGRTDLNNVLDQRTLREVYLRAWEIAVAKADPGAVMCAFPKINGQYACEDRQLLTDTLKDEWKFPGWVSTDFGAGHTWEQFDAGTDASGAPFVGQALKEKVLDGTINPARFADMVHRVLRTMFARGLFENPAPGTTGDVIEPSRPLPAGTLDQGEQVAERAALAGSVLLKNRRAVLPLGERLRSVAVLGSGADEYITGTGSPQVPQAARLTTILEGLRDRAAENGTRVGYEPGIDPVRLGDVLPGPTAVPSSVLEPASGRASGLTGEYFANPNFAGDPIETRVDDQVNIRTGLAALIETFDKHTRPEPTQVPFPLLTQPGSIRWTGSLNPVVSGPYTLSLTNYGSARLFIDGERVVSNPGESLETQEATINLRAGQSYEVRIDYSADATNQCCVVDQHEGPTVRFGWVPPRDTASPQIQQAVALARRSSAAVVVVRDDVGEATDRYTLGLPQGQDRLIRAVAAVNPRTVVVSATSGPVLMPWLNQADAVVQSWYPGEAGGRALASLLYGDSNFSGRLPVTFPRSEAQVDRVVPQANPTPDFGVDAPTIRYTEGVFNGYRGYLKAGQRPLFPFGHGLSYTSFRYSRARTVPALAQAARGGAGGKQQTVQVTVRNTGRRVGTEVVHAYVGALPTTVATPARQLAGSARVTLAPGRSRTVRIKLEPQVLRYWSESRDTWVSPRGIARVYLGGSVTDARAAARVRLR